MQPPSSSQAATQAAFLTGLSPVPPEGGARAGTPGRMPDGRGVTITTTADHLQPPPARPPARAPERPPKRHHSEMAPTQEAPLPEPDRKARTESPRSPRPNRPPGPAVIDHVFTHSTYATIRLDLLPCVVGQAAQAALMSSLEPEQRELAGRELARRLGRQAETREVQGRLFRQLHGLLATTKEQASTPGARA